MEARQNASREINLGLIKIGKKIHPQFLLYASILGHKSSSPVVGAGRGNREFPVSSPPSSMSEDIMVLDIYADSQDDIKKCKVELDTKLDKATTTLMWKDKPTYEDDRELIKKLSADRVSTTVNFRQKPLPQSIERQ